MHIILLTLIIISLGIRHFILFTLFIPLIIYLIKKKDIKLFLLFFVSILIGALLILRNFSLAEEQISTVGIITQKRDNYVIITTLKGNYYYYQKNNNLEIFDILRINGSTSKIVDTALEGEFSFKNYLYGINVEYEINIKECNYLFDNPLSRDNFINLFLDNLNREAKYIIGNIFFNKSYDDYDLIFNKLGISYLLSFSSIYIYLFFNIINFIIKLFSHKIKVKSEIVAIILLIPLLILSRYKLSFLKTYIILINKYCLKKKINYLTLLTSFLIIILIINPHYIYSLSFIYLFLLSYIRILLSKGIKLIDEKYKKIAEIVIYSLLYGAINIIINGSYNLFLPIIQIFSVLLFQIIFILGILSFFIAPLTFLINNLSTLYVKIYSFLCKISLPLYFNILSIGILIIILLFLICYFIQIGLKRVSKYLSCVVYLTIAIFASPIDSMLTSYIIFINVGQGDATLIHNKNIDILVDTGGSLYKDIGNEVIIPFLKKLHIYDLDYLVITHNDFDHSGASDTILNGFEVKNYIIGSSFEEILIDNFKIINLNQYNYDSDENDGSSVLYFNFLDMYFLLMGDVSTIIERNIMHNIEDIDVDILKVGHHGSNTSTSLEFLKYTMPKEAIISCGINNKYNHPSDDVIRRLNALNIKIRRTDLEGSIKYTKSI